MFGSEGWGWDLNFTLSLSLIIWLIPNLLLGLQPKTKGCRHASWWNMLKREAAARVLLGSSFVWLLLCAPWQAWKLRGSTRSICDGCLMMERAHHRGSNPLDPSLLVLRCCNQGRRLQWTCAQQKGQKEGCETVDWEMEAVHKEISRTWDHCCPSNANICPPSNQLLHVETEAVSLLSFSTHKPLCMPLNPIAEKYFIGSVFGSLFFTISMNWQKCTPNFSPPTSQWSVQLQFCSCHFKMSTLHAT